MSAIHNPRSTSTGADRAIKECIAWSRGFSFEFPVMLANHLPMILFAMYRMGASEERLRSYCTIYQRDNGLVPVPERVAPITLANFEEGLGDRSREADYRAFFADLVGKRGGESVAREFLPRFMPGFTASALHAFMRTAYSVARADDDELAVGLAYWATCYLELGRATGGSPTTSDPLDTLLYMYGPDSFRHVVPETDLLWHNMRATAALPEFKPVADMLEIGPGTLESMAKVSLVLFASTMDFCALHALTGCHWMRMMAPVWPDRAAALRYFWQGITALVPKIGFPSLLNGEEVEAMRQAHAPDWVEIFGVAVQRDDEHDLSLTFSASEEEKLRGDRLYRVLAAKRLSLI